MKFEKISIREALRQAMKDAMTDDKNVFLLGEEVAQYQGAYKISKGLLEEFGAERVRDTPIAEAAFSGFAVGAAMAGMRPIVEFMSFNFSFVAFDQIVNRAAKIRYMTNGQCSCPIVMRGPNGAAAQVSSQHSHDVAGIFAGFPGLHILAPSDPQDSYSLLRAAINCNDPVLFLEHEMIYHKEGPLDTEKNIEIGKAKRVREGTDITIIAYSRALYHAEEAANRLENEGYSVEIIDLRSIKPLDVETIITSVKKTSRAVVVEEGHLYSGIGAEVVAQLQIHCFDALDAPVVRVASTENPLPYSKNIEEQSLPNKKRIYEACKIVLDGIRI